MAVMTGTAVNWRFDPFTEAYNAVQQLNEDHVVPGVSPYTIRLIEVPRQDSPSTVTCTILVELDEDLDAVETDVDVLAADYGRVLVNDIILVDSEKLEVTAKPGSPTLTCNRGYGGTTPAVHTDGTQMEILDSMTEIASGSPATREFRVDYKFNTGLVLLNSAQAAFDLRFDYWGLGSPFHEGWTLGDGYVTTAKLDTDAVTTVKILDGNVTVPKLALTEGSWSADVPNASRVNFSVNAYSHLMQTQGENADIDFQHQCNAEVAYVYKMNARNADNDNPRWAYAKWHYHSSSPPQEVWIELSPDGKKIVQVWKSEPIGYKGEPVVPIEPCQKGEIFRFGRTEMFGAMRSHDRYKNYSPEDLINYHLYLGMEAGEIVDDEQWQDIMVREGRKKKK